MKAMTSRERVLTTLAHGMPDRVPMDLMGTAGGLENNAYYALCDFLGIAREGRVFRCAWNVCFYNEKILELLDVDFRRVWMREPKNWQPIAVDEHTEIDEWGMAVKRVGNAAWFANEPLAEASTRNLDNYPWPDPADPARIEGLAKEVCRLHEDTPYAISVRQATPGIFELAQRLRGPARFMMDLAADRQFALALVGKINEIRLEYLQICLNEIGRLVHMVEYADDFGSQTGPLISPRTFVEVFLPAYQAQNELIKQLAPGARIFMHSDGAIRRLVPYFIESGVEVLNPVEPDVPGNDLARLKEEFGERLIFHGHLNTKSPMRGSLEDVRKEIDRVGTLADGGGVILAPTNHFQTDVPPQNIVEAFRYATHR
jgi:uroporphyrinogen decarboxylase